MPNWLEAASAAPSGAVPPGVIPTGPLHAPAPSTQRTSVAPLLATTTASRWVGIPSWLDTASASPAGAVPPGVIPTGPLHAPAPSDQRTSVAPFLATTKTSVWLGIPNWLDAASAAPAGAVPPGVIPTGPFHAPAPSTQRTSVAPLLAT